MESVEWCIQERKRKTNYRIARIQLNPDRFLAIPFLFIKSKFNYLSIRTRKKRNKQNNQSIQLANSVTIATKSKLLSKIQIKQTKKESEQVSHENWEKRTTN